MTRFIQYPVLLLAILSVGYLRAQRTFIKGVVLNEQETPVPRAMVSVDHLSVSTNSAGEFIIRCEILPNVVTVRHHRYATREQLVNLPPPGTDTLYVVIHLQDKSTDLEEVTVTASRVIWAYPKAYVHVIDFDLREDGMLLLCKDHNQYLVRKVDLNSEPLFDLPVARHPKHFFRSCDGDVHVVYNDSAFRILITGDSLRLTGGITKTALKERLEPCALTVSNKMIYRYTGSMGQSVDYVMIDTLSHHVRRLYTAKGRKYQRAYQEFQKEVELAMRDAEKRVGDNSADRQLELYEMNEKLNYYRSLLTRPVYAPVFMLRDSIVIFDHANDSAVVFHRSGRPVRSFPIIYQHHKKWDTELIMNEEGTRIFARYDYSGMARLVEIDPTTGETVREIPLEKHIYPEKIQVKGNFIYYIFHHFIDYSVNYVYKQRIE